MFKASQGSDVGSIPIACSITPFVDAVEFTGSLPPKFRIRTEFWTQLDADSGRNGHLGRDDSGVFRLMSAYRVYQRG